MGLGGVYIDRMKTSVGLPERYAKEISGVLGCFDRVVVTGTLTEIAHPK